MAGAHVKFTLNEREWEKAQRNLDRLLADPYDLLVDIGEHLLLSTDEQFERQIDPEGRPWERVSDRYASRKEQRKVTRRAGAVSDSRQVLQLTRDMRRLVRYQVDGHELLQGSDRIYAATHQFGDPSRNIPERRWLGLSTDDDEAIEELLVDHLERAVDAPW